MDLKNGFIKVIVFLVCVTGFLSLSAQTRKPLSESDKTRFESHYYNGAREKLAQNVDEAIKQFRACLLIDAQNDAVYFNLSELFLAKKMVQDAKENVAKAIALAPDNLWYRKLQVSILEISADFAEAGKGAEFLSKHETPVLHLIEASGYYEQARDYSRAVKMLDQAEKIAGLNEEIITRKEQMYLAMNKVDKAAKEIRKLCNAYPSNMRYQVLLAELYLVNNRIKEGVDLYRKVMQKEPGNGYAAFALADYYRTQGDSVQFFEFMKAGMASKDVDVKSKLRMMVLFMTSKNFADHFERSQILADVFIQAHPGEPTCMLVKGDLYIEQGNFDKAHEAYQQAILLDPSIQVAYQQMIFCDNRRNDVKQLQADCMLAIERFPNETNFHIYLTIANLQLKEYEMAVSSALRGIEVASDEKEALAQFYVSLGDAYHYLKKVNACDSAFEKALSIDSNNAYALNNYAYFLSLRKLKLDRAEAMSRRSLDIDPNNPSYADTYGWILFQQKNYEKAKAFISRSLEMEPGNTEVMDHLGDVLYHLNNKEAAIVQWKKAKESGRTDELLEKKIRDGKFYEQ